MNLIQRVRVLFNSRFAAYWHDWTRGYNEAITLDSAPDGSSAAYWAGRIEGFKERWNRLTGMDLYE